MEICFINAQYVRVALNSLITYNVVMIFWCVQITKPRISTVLSRFSFS